MNYEGFKQYVADHIKEFLPQDYSVHEIGITKQRKNNDVVLDALSIKGDSNIVPVIYLEPYYQAYTDGVRMDDIFTENSRHVHEKYGAGKRISCRKFSV